MLILQVLFYVIAKVNDYGEVLKCSYFDAHKQMIHEFFQHVLKFLVAI